MLAEQLQALHQGVLDPDGSLYLKMQTFVVEAVLALHWLQLACSAAPTWGLLLHNGMLPLHCFQTFCLRYNGGIGGLQLFYHLASVSLCMLHTVQQYPCSWLHGTLSAFHRPQLYCKCMLPSTMLHPD